MKKYKEIKEIYGNFVIKIKKTRHSIDETHKTLRIIDFKCNNHATFDSLKDFINKIVENNYGKCILKGQVSGKFELGKLDLHLLKDDILTLVIQKCSVRKLYRFFELEGLKKALNEPEFTSTAKKVWILEDFTSFSSITTKFCQWGSNYKVSESDWKGLIDPREIVRDLTVGSATCVPYDIRPWLLRPGQKIEDSKVFNTWKIAAAKKIALALPSEVNCFEKCTQITFKGEQGQTKKIEMINIKDEEYLNLFKTLHECAEWIFRNTYEAETKHDLLVYQLVFGWDSEKKWPDKSLIERSFTSAYEAFRLHLQKASKELLKYFSEIKKSLHEEVNKVCDNTRNIITNLWRDFAIAAAVLILKFVTGKSEISPYGIRIIYTATSSFLLISLTITIAINARFNKIIKNNRTIWYKKLYPFLDKESLNELVIKPISKSLVTYRWVVGIIFVIYLAISIYLLNLAYP
jgi:hypothetical protein